MLHFGPQKYPVSVANSMLKRVMEPPYGMWMILTSLNTNENAIYTAHRVIEIA